jgi:hypothetical protein
MTTAYTDVFTSDEISVITSLDSVIDAEKNISYPYSPHSFCFTAELPDSIKETIKTKIGLDLFNVSDVPMTFLKGDFLEKIYKGESDFDNVYIIYLTNTTGDIHINMKRVEIRKGNACVFQSGSKCEIMGACCVPWYLSLQYLMIGPMSESGFRVE